MALPSTFALKTTVGNIPYMYLSAHAPHGFLVYRAKVLDPLAKFAVERTTGLPINMVHIRSCALNKYWVRSSPGSVSGENAIVATADEPVVDQTSRSCTLFRVNMDNNRRATFYHVQTGRALCIGNKDIGGNYAMFLNIDPASTTVAVAQVVDYDSITVLPRLVAFKGSNNLYFINYSGDRYSSFTEGNVGHPDIVCECHYSIDGHLRIRAAASTHSSFWITHGDSEGNALIVAAPSVENNVGQMFDVVRVSGNVIALRSKWNNKICMRADYPGSRDPKERLVAKANGMVNDARLEVIEPVFNRTVTVYQFDLDKARIYGVELLYSDDHEWKNPTDETQSGTANGTIITTKTKTYTNTINVSATVKTSFETGIPFIAKGEIEVSATAGYSHQWSEMISETQQIGHIFTVVVPPRKTTIARGVATKGRCDVPFAYVQKDYPTDGGPPIITELYDGVFTGANAYSFKSEVWYEELPRYSGPAPTKCIKRVVPAAKK